MIAIDYFKMGATACSQVMACTGKTLTCKQGMCTCQEFDTVEVQAYDHECERRSVGPVSNELASQSHRRLHQREYPRKDVIQWLTDRLLQEANDSAFDSRSNYMFDSRPSNFEASMKGDNAAN